MVRRRPSAAVALAVLLGGTSLVSAAAPSLDEPAHVGKRAERLTNPAELEMSPAERAAIEMVTIVNAERGHRGLPLLQVDARIMSAAVAHAADMAAVRTVQHTGSDGSDAGVRLSREGFRWSAWGENVGGGFTDPRTLFEAWMASPPHRDNLLGGYQRVGVGAVAAPDGVPYWCLVVADEQR